MISLADPLQQTTTFAYDGVGNRTAITDTLGYVERFRYDTVDRPEYEYHAVTGLLEYDDASRVNSIVTPQGAVAYDWDWAGALGARMTSATVAGQTVDYAYDALGVRVSATISGTTQNLLWDRAQGAPAELPLLVDDGTQSYIHGAGPMAQIDSTGSRHDLLNDGLGSVRSIIDGSGAVVGTADYSAFGEYLTQSGVTSRFGFTGEYYAEETGMWHLRARDLHPALGRFLSPDPVQPCPEGSQPGTRGYNRYAYVANNPTTWVDLSGFSAAPALSGGLAVAAVTYAMQGGFAGILGCLIIKPCR